MTDIFWTSRVNEHAHYYYTIFKSSRPEVFCEKVVLKNFAKFTRKHLCQSLFFWPATLLKKTMAQVLWCEFCKSFKNTFFIEHLRWLHHTAWNLSEYRVFSDPRVFPYSIRIWKNPEKRCIWARFTQCNWKLWVQKVRHVFT